MRRLPWTAIYQAMNKTLLVGILPTLMLLTGACGSKSGQENSDANTCESKVLTVSIEPQRQILEQLAGPSYTVKTMLSRGSNPETFDPSTGDRLAADKSAIYFATGVLPFEERLESSIKAEYVNTGAGINYIYGTHSHHHGHDGMHKGHADDGHGHESHEHHDHECNHEGHESHEHDGAPDPHYWSSVDGARTIAHNMATALIKHTPDSAAVINARLDRLMSHYDSLSTELDSILTPLQGTTFAVWHPSLSYFARDYGMTQLSLGTEGKELSAKMLREAIDKARAAGVKVLFFQQEYDSRQAEPLSNGIGARLVTINPLDYDWEGQLKLVADEIARP